MPKTIINQRCSHCHQIKPLDKFHKSKNAKNGVHNACKSCESKRDKTPTRRKTHRKALKRYRETKHGKQKRAEWRQTAKGKAVGYRYSKNYPEAIEARAQLNYAIRKGIIPKPTTQSCFDCGKPAQEYHHYLGYASEHHFHIRPYCYMCHKKADKSL